MNEKQIAELKNLYDLSDILFLKKLKEYRPDNKSLDFLIYLNNEEGIGWGESSPYEEIYYELKEAYIGQIPELNSIV